MDAFPTFPSGLLYVMGVSAAGYLGGKAVRNPGPILRKVEVTANNADLDVKLAGENLDSKATFRIDNALQKPTGLPSGPPQPQAPTGYSTELTLTLSQAVGFAQGDHVFEIENADGIGAQAIFTATPMKILKPPSIKVNTTGTVDLTVEYYREGSSARWLAPGGSEPIDIPAASVTFAPVTTALATPTYNVKVTVTAGKNTGNGTLTLVAPRGGTEATSVTVIP